MKWWCSHIMWSDDNRGIMAFWFKDSGMTGRADNWNFCPVCRAAKPKETTLAEKLYEAFPARHPHMDIFKHLAQVAEEHFKESR